jgi:thiol-disulfide isomerase/thioredoxin
MDEMKNRRRPPSALALVMTLLFAGAVQAGPGPGQQASTGEALAPSLGDVLPAFVADTVDGKSEYVDFPKGSSTVLVFFLSSCPHCHKMIPLWNKAFEEKPPTVKMIGVIMDQEPPGFFTGVPVSFPVVRSPGRAFLNSIKVRRAPLTLRVGAGGTVEDEVLGEIDPDRLQQFFKH